MVDYTLCADSNAIYTHTVVAGPAHFIQAHWQTRNHSTVLYSPQCCLDFSWALTWFPPALLEMQLCLYTEMDKPVRRILCSNPGDLPVGRFVWEYRTAHSTPMNGVTVHTHTRTHAHTHIHTHSSIRLQCTLYTYIRTVGSVTESQHQVKHASTVNVHEVDGQLVRTYVRTYVRTCVHTYVCTRGLVVTCIFVEVQP